MVLFLQIWILKDHLEMEGKSWKFEGLLRDIFKIVREQCWHYIDNGSWSQRGWKIGDWIISHGPQSGRYQRRTWMSVSKKWQMLPKEISQVMQHYSYQNSFKVTKRLHNHFSFFIMLLISRHSLWRFINNDGKNFIKNFQPEITRQIGPVLKNYMNM